MSKTQELQNSRRKKTKNFDLKTRALVTPEQIRVPICVSKKPGVNAAGVNAVLSSFFTLVY